MNRLAKSLDSGFRALTTAPISENLLIVSRSAPSENFVFGFRESRWWRYWRLNLKIQRISEWVSEDVAHEAILDLVHESMLLVARFISACGFHISSSASPRNA